MNTTWLTRGAAMLVLGAGMTLSSTGCTSNEITGDSVRANASPEMVTIAMTHEQRQNNLTRSANTNWRQLVDDWDRFWLLADPLHMSNIPIP